MQLGHVRLVSVALDMVGLMGLMMAWLTGVWATAGLLVAALVRMEPGLTVVAAGTAITGVLCWWISTGINRRKRFRTGFAGLGALVIAVSLAATLYYVDSSMLADMQASAAGMLAQLVFYAVLGVFLLGAAIAKPRD